MNANTTPSIVMIGSGNVATALAIALEERGLCPIQIYSPSIERASLLSSKLQQRPSAISRIEDLQTQADLYLMAISDRALPSCAASMPHVSGVVAHTAGSVAMDVLSPIGRDVGVLYPLQTFTMGRVVPFDHLPIYIESASPRAELVLRHVAELLSDLVHKADGEQRGALHLAAVFVCNFVNHFYAIGEHILANAGLNASALFPLIAETAAKVQALPSLKAQTGPAVRADEITMQRHLALLAAQPELADLYRLLSNSIIHLKLKTNRE